MDHLLFPRRIDPMHVYGALLYDIKSLAAIALAKKVFPLVEVLRNDERGDRYNVCGGQTHEELTTAQRIFNDRLSKLARFQRHAGILTLPGEWSRQKKRGLLVAQRQFRSERH